MHHGIRSLLQKVGWEVEGERRWDVWGDEVWPDRQWVQQELTTQPVPGTAFGASLPLLSARCLPHSTNSSLHLHYQPLVMTVCTAMFSTAGLCSLRYISGAASLHKGSYLPTVSQKLCIRARARSRQQGFQLGLENRTHTHTQHKNQTHPFLQACCFAGIAKKKSKKDLYAVIRIVIIIKQNVYVCVYVYINQSKT